MEYVYYSRIGRRGEFTINDKAQKIFGISPGDYVIVSPNEKRNGVVIRKATIRDLKRYGRLKRKK